MSDTADMAAIERVIDTYCEAWNEPDTTRRSRLLETVWAEVGTYTDPRTRTFGVGELSAYIGQVLARYPGARVVRTSAIDAHHGLVRFAWRLVQPDGTELPESTDFAAISRDWKLMHVVGFFGALAPVASAAKAGPAVASTPQAMRH